MSSSIEHGVSPIVADEIIGERLIEYRHESGMTLHDVSQVTDVAPSVLSRLENRARSPKESHIRSLLACYGKEDVLEDTLGLLEASAEGRKQLAERRKRIPPGMQEYMEYEGHAAKIRSIYSTLMPDMMCEGGASTWLPYSEDKYVEASFQDIRRARTEYLLGHNAPSQQMVLGATALLTAANDVGFSKSAIIAAAENPAVDVRVADHRRGANVAMQTGAGRCALLLFDEPEIKPRLYYSNNPMGMRRMPSDYVPKFEKLFALAVEQSTAPEDSLAAIDDVLKNPY